MPVCAGPRARSRHRGLSAHADYRELLDWLAVAPLGPRRVFVTQGEPAAADAFRRRLVDSFGWDPIVPEMAARFELT
jgi:metallo-beta-lactamase family protein